MNTFTACVERGENWWVAQLVEDPGVIVQARRLDQIQEEIRDALALFPKLTDSPETASVHLDLVGEIEQKAQATRDQLAAIRECEAHELANMSQHARRLQAAGVLRDSMQIASGSQAARS
ncbi:hypothetical protein [Corynebacterium diphtheriae]|uniref:Uncharacterized protein n=2 Tax=Corynebacterium diphtheriae TaxID=1717 RepID=Q6NJF0_CORDI|nr:hypothetical protein [Corynebacterium diphtheriae]ARB88758.1 hypothetical protein A6J36_10915 [Corynebacterium diphtheriae]KKA82275.1 hypothetical protein VN94_02590 [Corynebacterium diphtheriae]OWM34463.1 hypothetical protein AY602_07180 [Corynebacterium diphtheriae bv. mitis]OWM47703.1 hypothetical protein BU160_03155 [Corynebacterium diphtheriae]OWM56722.1 hypothetical protein BU162_05285 [Corynebacterium diphtheriae]